MQSIFARHWRVVVAMTLCLIVVLLPEVMKSAPLIPPKGALQALLLLVLLTLLLTLAISSIYGLLLAVMVSILQWSDVIHLQYFGAYFRRRDFLLASQESKDIFLGLMGSRDVWQAYVAGLIASIFLIALARRILPWRSRKGALAGLALLLLPISVVGSKEPWRTEPDNRKPAIVNALYAWGGFVVDQLSIGRQVPTHKWLEYQVKPSKSNSSKPSILLVIGESLNPSHMGIMGYGRDTTPHIVKLLHDFEGGHGEIISAGVSTRVSIPTFLNIVREPGHDASMRSSPANLFRLAKRERYQTALVSVQELTGISAVIGKEAIDHWIDAVDRPASDGFPDGHLLDRVKDVGLDLHQPFFMVVNTRATHLPYESNFPKDFAAFSKFQERELIQNRINAYDDSMRWFDFNVHRVVSHVMSTTTQPVVVIMISDHGQIVGKNGRFGHNVLDRDVYVTPYVWLVNDAAKSFSNNLRKCPLNHYRLASKLADLLGYEFENPNEKIKPDTFWVNGTSLDGASGSFSYSGANWLPQLKCGS